ncbi:hypothetical protein UCREL1_10600 [Eutypa lata UCREL1]|uniref:RRM domain-containing protein n=1 Tax=Eutypa lata (strain UCR-EL1) TaxID=1287681 RepID=M7SE35_EUTLA|nr:hypothetical protein UCREL1_10600 [Eutypa lata UCREL1]
MSAMKKRDFFPSNTVTGTPHETASEGEAYKGDLKLKANKDEEVKDEENCRVYIKELRYNLTYRQLLEAIRNCGKVKACHINNSNPQNPLSSDAAITFFDRASAEALVRQAGTFRIPGSTVLPRIFWNRNKVGPEDDEGKSRVVRVNGNAQFVNEASLLAFFEVKFTFNLEKVVTVYSRAGMAQLDFFFSSWSAQAQSAKKALELEYPEVPGNLPGVQVHIRPDPCAPQ